MLGIKLALRKKLPDAEIDPIFSITHDNENQFFMKSAAGIIWGRVFYQPFNARYAEIVNKEGAHLARTFRQPVHLYLFSPDFKEAETAAQAIVGNAFFYEYQMESSLTSDDPVILKEWNAPQFSVTDKKSRPAAPMPSPAVPPQEKSEDGHFFKSSQLNKDEIKDLIEIALEIKS